MKNASRRLVALLTGTAIVVAGLAFAPPAAAVEDVTSTRLAGNERFQTAAAVAKAAFPQGATNVIVASGRAFPDALAGAALSGDLDAPVLLTERDELPAATATAIDDLNADNAYILGGTAAVSEAVATSLQQSGLAVTRIAGQDRYDTAAEIGEAVGADSVAVFKGKRTAIIATGLNFADALAGGPVAGAGAGDKVHPILLVNTAVPTATEAAIAALDIDQVVILGGTAAVSSSVEQRLEQLTGSDAVRLAGADRYATAIAVAEAALADVAFTAEEILLANGLVFADALAGGPLGAVRKAPIVLTEVTTLPTASRSFLERQSPTIERLTVLGGTAAVSNEVVTAAENAAESEPPRGANETIAVDPTDDADQANGTSRAYTASGLGSTPVDIALLNCADVTIASGDRVFANTNTNAFADGTARAGGGVDEAEVANAHIASVNGSTRSSTETPAESNNDYANNVAPANGSVTFSVSGPPSISTATVCVVPVVFVDANVDNALNGATSNPTKPTEAFGTGGATTFSPSGASAGQFGDHEVQSTAKGTDRFTACAVTAAGTVDTNDCKTYRYDSNDTFQISSAPVTMAVWEAALSVGDRVRGSYAAATTGTSTFNLDDRAPAEPTGVTTSTSGTIVRVSFTDSATPTVDLYRLYRATQAAGACPDFDTSTGRTAYTAIPAQATVEGQPQGETNDTGNAGPGSPAPTYTIADRTAAASTTYCYVVVSVDKENSTDANGDESTGHTAASATTAAAPRPIIIQSSASSLDTTLSAGDVLTFVFDRDVAGAEAASVTVRGSNTVGAADEMFTCGSARASCSYDAPAKTLRVTILATTTPTQQYPLTLEAMTGVTAGGEQVDVTNSDRTIQRG